MDNAALRTLARRFSLPRLDLLAKFAVVSALSIAALGAALALLFQRQAEDRASRQALETTELVGEIARTLGVVPQAQERFDDLRFQELERALAAETPVTGLALWNGRGGTFYASDTRLLVDERPTEGELARALRLRIPTSRRVGDVLRVYAPLPDSPDRSAPSVIQLDYSYRPIQAELAREQRRTYAVLAAALLALWAALFRIAAGASVRLRRNAAEKEHMALHDSLTGLPNRTLFLDRGNQAIRSARREGRMLGVLLMDLNRFKEVNDTLGHGAGDRLLGELAGRIGATLRASDTVARLGGDEFAVLLPRLLERADAVEAAERLLGALEDPFVIQGLPVALDASVGIALYPEHGEEVEALLQRADIAMYESKSGHTSFEFYDADQDVNSPNRLALIGELRRAIDERELVLHYQPKAELRTGRVRSLEALVRWQHPERGLLQPGEFLPLAQHTSLIKPLTSYVLAESLRQCREWQRHGHTLGVSVNLSARSLLDSGLPAEIAGLLERSQVEPGLLELEITESTIMADPVRALDVLTQLSELGVVLSIDDFGTGYSSLAYLKELPVDEVKIDRSFVGAMDESSDSAVIVRSTIDLGRNLGLAVVAEGVESEQVCRDLRDLGCDLAQGFFLCRPVPAEDVLGSLEDVERQLAGLAASRP